MPEAWIESTHDKILTVTHLYLERVQNPGPAWGPYPETASAQSAESLPGTSCTMLCISYRNLTQDVCFEFAPAMGSHLFGATHVIRLSAMLTMQPAMQSRVLPIQDLTDINVF